MSQAKQDKPEQVRVFALASYRFARSLDLRVAEARRVAEVFEGEPYTADVAVERVAAELARWGGAG